MKDQQIGRLFRLLRVRKGWRQEDAADRAGISRKVAQKIEHGELGRTSLDLVRKYGRVFDVRIDAIASGRGGDLARTADEEHAMIVEQIAALVTDAGWTVEPEASFNHYGDRGRIDLLGYHPATATLLLVEVKTMFTDLQDMFGSMNVKLRVVPQIARARGWHVVQTGSWLAVASSPAARKIVHEHATLFAPFVTTAARIKEWMRLPVGDARMLLWVRPPEKRRAWYAGRQRIRTSGSPPGGRLRRRANNGGETGLLAPGRVRISGAADATADTAPAKRH